MVSLCLPSDAFLQHLPSYLVFSYLGLRVSLQGCSSKAQLLLLTLGEGYLLTTAPLGPLARQWLSILKLQILQSRYKLLWMLLLARETAAFPVPLCPVTGTSSPNFSLLYFQVALMPGAKTREEKPNTRKSLFQCLLDADLYMKVDQVGPGATQGISAYPGRRPVFWALHTHWAGWRALWKLGRPFVGQRRNMPIIIDAIAINKWGFMNKRGSDIINFSSWLLWIL